MLSWECMRNMRCLFFAPIFILFLGWTVLPIHVDAKTAQPLASRCLTKEIKRVNGQAVLQMEKDISKSGADHEASVKTYREKMATIWAAMKEPYCGYGSRGMRAVRSSFMKSINKTRAQFLSSTKLPPLAHATSTSATVLVNATTTSSTP